MIPSDLLTPSNWDINENRNLNNNREDKEIDNTNFIESDYFDFEHFFHEKTFGRKFCYERGF